mgnify:CR=1 FL=1
MEKQLVSQADIESYEKIKDLLSDREWRLNNLYYIVNDKGVKVKFKMNSAQSRLYKNMWWRNIILKARQRGITTFVMILMLDAILFNSNVSCAVIAQGQKEALDLFEKKIRFAYTSLPAWLLRQRTTEKCSASEIRLNNKSSIIVSTSARSGTFQYLHISEYGKICKKWPDKAEEIKTGSLPAARAGITFIESTAEGRHGAFHDMSQTALKMQKSGIKHTRLDYRLFFFPWWNEPANALSDEDADATVIPDRHFKHFYELEQKYGIETTRNQQVWYVKEEAIQGDKMKQEHPSFPEEAFEQSSEGTYFARQFTRIYSEKRITKVPYQPAIPVDTWWDLGMSDAMVIWFSQTVGRQIHVIDYYENSGEGFAHYGQILKDKKYNYGKHTGPHDLEVRELGPGVSRVKSAKLHGINFLVAPKTPTKQDSIDAARAALDVCWFDESKCSEGINGLEAYTKIWNDKMGCWSDTPRHDWSSNPSDGFQTLAMAHPMFIVAKNQRRTKTTKRSSRVRG